MYTVCGSQALYIQWRLCEYPSSCICSFLESAMTWVLPWSWGRLINGVLENTHVVIAACFACLLYYVESQSSVVNKKVWMYYVESRNGVVNKKVQMYYVEYRTVSWIKNYGVQKLLHHHSVLHALPAYCMWNHRTVSWIKKYGVQKSLHHHIVLQQSIVKL